MTDSDVEIKIASDVEAAIASLGQLVDQFAAMSKAVTTADDAADKATGVVAALADETKSPAARLTARPPPSRRRPLA